MLISLNTNASSLFSRLSTVVFSNMTFSSSSLNLSLFSSERVCYLLKNETKNYAIIDNDMPLIVAAYWSVFGFPAKLKQIN